MKERRKDNRGRILHEGETQRPDGRYRYRYISWDGKEKDIYSWRLDIHDKMPPGKKFTVPLREMKKQIQADQFDKIVTNGGNMSVYDLAEKYVATKIGVRVNTRMNYNTVLNFLRKDPFGKKRIDTVRKSDAIILK